MLHRLRWGQGPKVSDTQFRGWPSLPPTPVAGLPSPPTAPPEGLQVGKQGCTSVCVSVRATPVCKLLQWGPQVRGREELAAAKPRLQNGPGGFEPFSVTQFSLPDTRGERGTRLPGCANQERVCKAFAQDRCRRQGHGRGLPRGVT